MVSRSLPEYLVHLLEKKGLSQKDVIRASGLSASYACHIFSGERSTTRPKMLAIALAMKLTVEETQYLLHYAGLPQLYARPQGRNTQARKGKGSQAGNTDSGR